MRQGNQPKEVSQKTNHEGEVNQLRQQWGAEPCVWSDRMLTALKSGVKGGKWFSLKDKVYALKTLRAAFEKVAQKKGSAGVDHVSIERFQKKLENNLMQLHRELKAGTYRPQPVKRVLIPKPGSREKRPLGIPTVRDRIVQTALEMVIGPIFEAEFAESSYGFRPGRSCKDALREVEQRLKAGHEWIVDADLKSYFDTIDHKILMDRVREHVADGLVLDLLESYLKQGVLNTAKQWEPTDQGTPQGAVVSPLLANVYLNELDHQLNAQGCRIVRYADDFVILCQSREEAQGALEMVQEWTQAHALTLHPEKTKLVTHEEGFEFLGYRFMGGKKFVRKKSLKQFREKLRKETKRTNGHSMEAIIGRINPVLRGWFGYYQHAHYTTFNNVDGWVRMRLRSILRKRHKRKGRGRGRDHNRWPNAYFAKMGLFCLERAHREVCQSH